jgi:formylglycine-generating enzyme required for sulfatase activity
MAHDVFISYSSRDKAKALAICDYLESRGIVCWLAPRDVNVGEEYAVAIVDAIDSSSVVLLVETNNANDTPQVRREIERAISKQITVFPIRLEDAQRSKAMEYYIDSVHWMDAFPQPLNRYFTRLEEEIRKLLPEKDEPKPDPNDNVPPNTWWSTPRIAFAVIGLLFLIGLFAMSAKLIGSGDSPVTQPQNTSTRTVTVTLEETAMNTPPSPTFTLTPSATKTELPSETPTLTQTLPDATLAFTDTLTPLPDPTSSPTSTPEILATRTAVKDSMTQVYVPSGEFLAGRSNTPQRLDGYWIDRTEITNTMYARCENAQACQPPAFPGSNTRGSDYYSDDEFANFPVIYVTWEMAERYCQWVGRRLPSALEWEKAARGTDGRNFPWGSDLPDATLLNFNNNINDTSEVGSYPDGASPYDVLDMGGNVWEWVSDQPSGEGSDKRHLYRGGAWDTGENRFSVRASFVLESHWYNDIGFRCAQDRTE